ncbi:ankyrin repeat and SOCS box protein 13 [Caerostris extrusa]|uniref:Ankyrin repeat and SOCS box protein 13 n=1 Tax=Caerostris extrusa TaxID=172846 RepID=A0AAV4Y4H6_CAEEX|nr:ankyrin repeat and SOCS box protein 13 [Caerostris extrusa]
MNADVNAATSRGTALHVACLKGSPECTSLLIKAGADLAAKDSRGLHHFMQPHLEIAQLELFSKDKKAALHIAAINNQLEIAKVLIEYGANVYSKDDQNKMPVDLLPQQEGDLFDLLVQSAAQPVSLKDLCRRTICTTLGQSRLKHQPNFNIPAFGCI